MGKVVGVIVLILAIAAGVIFGVPSVRAKVLGVPLKMQFKVGQETRRKMTIDGKVNVDVTGLPDGVIPPQANDMLKKDIPFKMEMRMKEVVKAVNGDVADIENTVEGGEMQITLPGQTEPTKQPLPAQPPTTVQMDTQGRVKLNTNTQAVPGMSAAEMQKVQEFISNLSGGFLPGDTRRVGQSWSQDIKLPIDVQKAKINITGNISNTFENVDQKNNVTVADIAGKQDIKIDVTSEQPGVDVKLTGGITGSNHGYFDWGTGQIVATDGNAKLDLTLVVKSAQGPGGKPIDATGHLTGDMKVNYEKL